MAQKRYCRISVLHKSLIPTFSFRRRPSEHSPRFLVTPHSIGASESGDVEAEVDVVVIKLNKDIQHRPSPGGEG